MTPATPADAKGMLKTALRGRNPVLFIENLALYNTVVYCAHDLVKPGIDVFCRAGLVEPDVNRQMRRD